MNLESAKEQSKEFFQLGGHSAVVTVMNQHPYCEVVQRRAIGVIGCFSFANDNLLNIAIGKVKGVHALLAAMKKFPIDLVITTDGFFTLANLAGHNHNANGEILVTQLKGIPFLLERLSAFSHDEDIVKFASDLFRRLSQQEELRDSLIDAKVVTVLGPFFDGNYTSPKIKEYAKEALNNLTSD